MKAIKAISGWFLRQGILFVLIVAAIAFHQFVWPAISDGAAKSAVIDEWKSPGEVREQLRRLQAKANSDLRSAEADLIGMRGDALDAAVQVRRAELANVVSDLDLRQGVFASIRPTSIIARERLKLRRETLSAEISLLEAVRVREARERALAAIQIPHPQDVSRAARACGDANKAVKHFNSGSYLGRSAGNIIYGRADALTKSSKEACGTYRSIKTNRDRGLIARNAAQRSAAESEAALSLVRASLSSGLRQYSPDVARSTIRDLLLKAGLVFLGLVAMPFVIRTIFYYLLAPLAERRASIRISVPEANGVPIPPVHSSRVSVLVALRSGEELLVRQDYLQTSSLGSRKDTRWLLDYRHILSSFASGLSFLTRISGEGDATTVSAVRDPFAELAEVCLPAGSACILHPRALVAVVQAQGQPMRISSHWRLFSLSAWLTLQLRYLVFHGECRLIVKGGRGIRVEHAEQGRIFGQDQLVGFSADLSYSVARTETFAPYLFGREQLFKDRVERGSGILIIEEAPLASRQGRGIRSGLEGGFDVILKVFGI